MVVVLTGEHLGLVRLAFLMVGLFRGDRSRVGVYILRRNVEQADHHPRNYYDQKEKVAEHQGWLTPSGTCADTTFDNPPRSTALYQRRKGTDQELIEGGRVEG